MVCDSDYKKIIKKYSRSELENKLITIYLKKCKKVVFRDLMIVLLLVIVYLYKSNFSEILFIAYRLMLACIVNPYVVDIYKAIDSECILFNPNHVPFSKSNNFLSTKIDVIHLKEEELSSIKFEQINLVEKSLLIVNSTLNDWSIVNDSISVANILNLYKADKEMKSYLVCDLQSNLVLKVPDHLSVLHQIVTENPSSWFALWNHCEDVQLKFFRKHFRKPKFLPSYAQMTDPSWIVVSHNYRDRILLPDESQKIMLIVQIHGASRFFIGRHSVNQYSEKSILLNKGQILLIPNFVDLSHEVSFQPRQLKSPRNESDLNVILILLADINYTF